MVGPVRSRRTKAQAAALLKIERIVARLRRRRAACLRRWPPELARAVLERERPAARRGGARAPAGAWPFWLAVPWALEDGQRPRGRGRSASFGDVAWGQYCLYQCIRLHDDVFDGHTVDLALVYAGDLFLAEARAAFARGFPPSSRFWDVFWSALETTLRAIVRVDAMQRRLGCPPAALAREYARVAAVLEVGTIAVCTARGRTADVAALRRFAAACAMADQIVDDLDDVADDLRRGRFNYVAQAICGGSAARRPDPEEARLRIARALAVGDGQERIFGAARRHLDRAAAIAAGLRVRGLVEFAGHALRSLEALERARHRARVKALFAPALAGGKRPTWRASPSAR